MMKFKNILIVRTDRIGDVVLTIPLAKVIKENYPDCRITFLVQTYTAPLLQNHDYIDQVLILKKENGKILCRENAEMLRQMNFDMAITVYPKFDIAWMIFRSGIKKRVGTGYRWYSFLFNEKVFEHRKDAKRHELEYNFNLLKKLGIEYNSKPDSVSFNIHVKNEDTIKIKTLLETENFDFSKKTAIIHPGSGGSAVDWPISKYKELIDSLARQLKFNLVITGGEAEKNICAEVAGNSGAINLAGKVSLSELTAVINFADLMVANSTGPIHIAAALGKYVIGFYPKIVECSPERWGPYTNRRTVFMPELNCSNCSRKQCEELNCMDSIPVEKVETEVIEKMKIISGK